MKFNVQTIFRRTLKTLLALVGLLVCLFLGLALYNHYSDEDLSPEAAAYFSTPMIKVPPSETNAVFAVWGLRVAEGKDPHAEGVAYWKRAQSAIKAKKSVPEAPVDLPLPEFPQCPKGELACQSWLMGRVNVKELVKKHRVVLDRYRQLTQYASFVSPHAGIESLHGPFAFQSLGVHRLWELDQLHRLQQGQDAAELLREIATDISFWTKANGESRLLIDKMLANSFIQQDYQLLALIAFKYPRIPKEYSAVWNALLVPLPASFFDMHSAMWGEHSTSFHLFHEIAIDGSGGNAWFAGVEHKQDRWQAFAKRVSLWFYQEHATQNSFYQRILKIRAIQQLPPSRLAQLKDSDMFDAECGETSLAMLKNPIGKTLVCISFMDWSLYPLKLHRTEAMRRLVVIQSKLLQHEPAEYAQLIQNLPADLRNPQNGKPPRLDLKARLLEFDWATRDGGSKPLRVGLP